MQCYPIKYSTAKNPPEHYPASFAKKEIFLCLFLLANKVYNNKHPYI